MQIEDRLTAREGTHYFSGMAMLARLVLEQAERDRDAGIATGTLVSGYPGSPLAGFDLQLTKVASLLPQRRIRLLPAGNEEQAVTALMGAQMLDEHPHSDYSGVTGFWYGKGPGADRAGDALKHANFAGTSQQGATVLLSGEDHEAKSSTMPFQQEYAFASAGIPVLYPSTVAEFRTLGLHAVALSRYSGCWVALKLVSSLCDSGQTVTICPSDVAAHIPDALPDGRLFTKRSDFSFFPGKNIDHERHLYRDRHAAVIAYARANGLNRVVSRRPGDRIGIVTAGKSTTDVRQALADLRLRPDALDGTGVALLVLGLTYPLDRRLLRDFATGLEEIIVVEEKRPFLEDAVRAAVQPLTAPLRVVGKEDGNGAPLLPVEGALDSDVIVGALWSRLSPVVDGAGEPARLGELAEAGRRERPAFAPRTPNFCSGCPHSASTVLADGQVAFGAPGCACFNTVIEQPQRHIDTMTQYGGEGAAWVGLAPFTDRAHLVQHVGDGAMYHSAYLNVRWAVATDTRITFKLLWNGVVANTGAQPAPGERGLAALTRGLESEGVRRIVICSKDPRQYRGQQLGRGVEVRPAHELVTVAEELAAVDGVTVLVYDESCANERRRRIKRGLLPLPTEHVLINERVCENCGDCGAKSNCMSLQQHETEFGPKTRIHESSCNQDYACVQGDCPSFATVRVRPGTGYRKPPLPDIGLAELPDPAGCARPGEPFRVYLPGVGGTGVLTVNAILSFAAMFDGFEVLSYDQTGAAQKWGPVLSSLTLLPEGADASGYSSHVGQGRADLLLALDVVASVAPTNLDRYSPRRTAAVINSDLFPTGESIRDNRRVVDTAAMRSALASCTRQLLDVPARTIAERLIGEYMTANLVVVGASCQAGLLPLRPAAIERAIELNAVSVAANIAAFRLGRLWAHDAGRVRQLLHPEPPTSAEERATRAARLRPRNRRAYQQLNARIDAAGLGEPTARLLAVRVAELIDYQAARLAKYYTDRVLAAAQAARQKLPDPSAIIDGIAANLYKLMAYKDEYEVARLYLDPAWRATVAQTFAEPLTVSLNLHPPLLRRLGRTRKMRFGPWAMPVLRLLRTARHVRGTWLDPFGPLPSRREERALLAWYEGIVDTALAALRPATATTVRELVELPQRIRGYEQVKSASAARARRRADELLAELERPRLPLLARDGTATPAPIPDVRGGKAWP